MPHGELIRIGIAVGVLTLAIGACNQREATGPDLQTTTGLQPRMEPMTVVGCVHSGALAENTFVLMVSQMGGASETATIQLTGAEDVNLRQLVGQKVEVSGTLEAEQQVASTSGTVEEKPAIGTAGTPVVEAKTEVDIKRLNVASVTPTGNHCE